MHACPECGQACYCNGDIDDCELPGGDLACDCCLLGLPYDDGDDWPEEHEEGDGARPSPSDTAPNAHRPE